MRYIILVILLLVLSAISFLGYQHYFGVDFIKHFNKNYELIYFKNKQVCLKPIQSNKCACPKLDAIYEPETDDSLTVFETSGKYGYINIYTGELTIGAKFEMAFNFDKESGLAAVVYNNKLGFITSKENYAIKPQYAKPTAYYGEVKFSNGFCVISCAESLKLGVIDINNHLRIRPIYDDINRTDEGFYLVRLNEKLGLFDSFFQLQLQPEFDLITFNSIGIVLFSENPVRQFLLGYDFTTILADYVFDEIEPIYIQQESEHSEEKHSSRSESGYSSFTISEKKGVIDNMTGKVIIPASWDEINYYSKGIFIVEIDYIKMLIDTKNNILN